MNDAERRRYWDKKILTLTGMVGEHSCKSWPTNASCEAIDVLTHFVVDRFAFGHTFVDGIGRDTLHIVFVLVDDIVG